MEASAPSSEDASPWPNAYDVLATANRLPVLDDFANHLVAAFVRCGSPTRLVPSSTSP